MSRDSILSALDDPNLAWIVLLVGILLICREFTAPGRVLPGVLGGLAMTLALWSLFHHPWRGWALALIFSGTGLVVFQAFQRWFWIPAISGAILIFLGARFLTEPRIALLPALGAVPLCGITAFLLRTGILARQNKVSLQ